jgi:hypothetical protein
MSLLIIYPPNTIDIAIDLPVDAPPRALRAAEAVVCPVPPLLIDTAPLNCVTPIVLLVNVVTLDAVTILVGVMMDESVVI